MAAIGRPVYTYGHGLSSPAQQSGSGDSIATERTCMQTQISNNAARVAPTIDYIKTFVGPSQRPNGKMPLSAHAEIGRLLKAIYAATMHKDQVRRPLEIARNTLDEWACQEYPDPETVPNEQLLNLYYHLPTDDIPPHIGQAERNEYGAGLRMVQEFIVSYYLKCVPRRALLKVIDRAINALETWK